MGNLLWNIVLSSQEVELNGISWTSQLQWTLWIMMHASNDLTLEFWFLVIQVPSSSNSKVQSSNKRISWGKHCRSEWVGIRGLIPMSLSEFVTMNGKENMKKWFRCGIHRAHTFTLIIGTSWLQIPTNFQNNFPWEMFDAWEFRNALDSWSNYST